MLLMTSGGFFIGDGDDDDHDGDTQREEENGSTKLNALTQLVICTSGSQLER